MARQRNPLPPNSTWIAFADRQRGQPFLNEDPIYALSENVVEAIKVEVPAFFTAEQEAFERDLARSTRHGFFLRRPIGCDRVGFAGHEDVRASEARSRPEMSGLTVEEFISRMRSLPASGQQAVLDQIGGVLTGQGGQGSEEATQIIQEFLSTLLNSTATRTSQGHREQTAQQQEPLQRRQEAYAGWLVLNPSYRAEVQTLRQDCPQRVVEECRFPCAGEYSQGPAPLPGSRQNWRERFRCFYQRWGLDRLLIWELPYPMGIVRCTVSQLAGQIPSLDGVALLISWPLLRGEQVDFQASLAQMRLADAPAHLADWFSSDRVTEQTASGQISYQKLFFLYRVYELVLFRRYKAACTRRLDKLDRALASVMDRNEEVVRKLRQRLVRTLRPV